MLSQQQAEQHYRAGAAALQAGRATEARLHLERLAASGQANLQIFLMLATACRDTGDWAAAERALDAVLDADPKVVRALVMKGDAQAATGRAPGALRSYKAAIAAAEGQALPPALAAEVARAADAIDTLARSAADALTAKLAAAGLPETPRSPRFDELLGILSGAKEVFVQEPTAFYFPGLPNIQYYDPSDFDWADVVEAATAAIRAELIATLDDRAGYRSYMTSHIHGGANPNGALIDRDDWSTLFLVENGARNVAAIARCPATWSAVERVGAPWIDGISPTAMFSLLKPGAHILPHTGMFNTRLTCHLPLIVPPGCGFRVGNEVREWEEGKLLIFDDTIEHEAWNRGDGERVVLIFDVWRPELSEQERVEVSALMRALQ